MLNAWSSKTFTAWIECPYCPQSVFVTRCIAEQGTIQEPSVSSQCSYFRKIVFMTEPVVKLKRIVYRSNFVANFWTWTNISPPSTNDHECRRSQNEVTETVCDRWRIPTLIEPASHRGRSEYIFTPSGQNPVLVNIGELLSGFPINRNQFVATSV